MDPFAWAPRKPFYEVVKRSIDVVASVTVLGLLSPLWLVIAVLIKVTSPGPALFRRTVLGHLGHPFTYYKFRSMISGDDTHHREWLRKFVTEDAAYREGVYKVADDPRVTAIGRVLRRFSVDEVPQFINVLKGDMSVVGPRPPLPFEAEHYDQRALGRLAVRPGITGLYQVTGRSQVPFSEMVAMDLDYIRRRTLGLDLWIMLRTVAVMVRGAGAA